MEVALTRDLEELVRDEVESGRYSSPSEVIREALRLFRQPTAEELDSLRIQIRQGLDDLDAGRYVEYDESSLGDLSKQVRARGLAKLKSR